MYKPSIFNHTLENSNGELLLYNAFVGVNSFCKFSKCDPGVVNSIVNSSVPISATSPLIDFLYKKGFIVDNDFNEIESVNLNYSKALSPGYLHLVINPTDSCNFKCIYCYENESNSFMSNDLQENIIQYVQKNIYKYSGIRISWFGGEPLLAVDAIKNISHKLIYICQQMRRSYYATITTNGYFLDLKTFEELVECRIFHYQITLDGLSEIHNSQRPLKDGGPTFERIIENLVSIRDNCKKTHYNITLRTNFTKRLAELADDYFKFIEKTFMCNPHFDVLIRPVDDWGGDRIQNIKDQIIDNSSDIIKKILHIMGKYRLNLNLMMNFFNPSSNYCYAAQSSSFSINSKGEISKCTTDLSNNSFAKIGNINKNGLDIDHVRESQWICKYNCECFCFYRPVCLGIKCPKAVIECEKNCLHKCQNVPCSFERQYIDDLLTLFDKQGLFKLVYTNDLFRIKI